MSDELSNDDIARILDAIDVIEACLKRLANTRETVDRADYKTDPDTQAMVERRFVKMTEAALDIGTVLILHECGEPPESNPKTMQQLEECGILSREHAAKMTDAARFRNILAHTYGRSIDHDLVYNALQDLARYRDFATAIRDYLDETESLDAGTDN